MVEGTVRRISILGTTVEDWQKVVDHLERGPYGARLTMPTIARPITVAPIFASDVRPSMFVDVADILLALHFVSPTELELRYAASDVTSANRPALLSLVSTLGALTAKRVTTDDHEYDPSSGELRTLGRDASDF